MSKALNKFFLAFHKYDIEPVEYVSIISNLALVSWLVLDINNKVESAPLWGCVACLVAAMQIFGIVKRNAQITGKGTYLGALLWVALSLTFWLGTYYRGLELYLCPVIAILHQYLYMRLGAREVSTRYKGGRPIAAPVYSKHLKDKKNIFVKNQ